MEFEKDVLKAYFDAVFNCSFNFNNEGLKRFKNQYPKEYGVLNAFYRLRSELNKDIGYMKLVGTVQWFTLTFDNKHDKSKVESKRKSATRFLNKIFLLYEIVEEYGEDKGRYHIHGFGVYREGRSFNDFIKWPSRKKIESLPDYKLHKKVRYLTKYTTKQLPRRRRSKNLVAFCNMLDTFKGLKKVFDSCYNCRVNLAIAKLRLYNEYATT